MWTLLVLLVWDSTAKLGTSSQHSWKTIGPEISFSTNLTNGEINTNVCQQKGKLTPSPPLCFSLSRSLAQDLFAAARTWAPLGPVLVFPGLGAVSAFSQTASQPTISLWSIGVWVILRWLHMTGCQKLDRVKRKAGISHSSAFLHPF